MLLCPETLPLFIVLTNLVLVFQNTQYRFVCHVPQGLISSSDLGSNAELSSLRPYRNPSWEHCCALLA